MDERLKFIARLLDGEKMAVLCRQFGISRKTGYKILTHALQRLRPGRAHRPLAPAPAATPISRPSRSRRGSCTRLHVDHDTDGHGTTAVSSHNRSWI